MRTMHRTTATVAALGIAFSLTACGETDTKSSATTPTVSAAEAQAAAAKKALDEASAKGAEEIAKTPPVSTPVAAPGYVAVPVAVDEALKSDMKNMAMMQESHIVDNPTTQGVAVTAGKPGGRLSVSTPNDFFVSFGNVIAVKLYPNGYCVSGYNNAATKATSASMSMLYLSEDGGFDANLGAC